MDALVRLGSAKGVTGDLQGAIDCFDKALFDQFESVIARFNLGRALFYQGKFAEACREYRDFALNIDDELPGIRLILSDAFAKSGAPRKHTVELKRTGSRPTQCCRQSSAGKVIAADQPQVALQLLEESRQMNPRMPEIVLSNWNDPAETKDGQQRRWSVFTDD